jgi:formiminotetrahydrofolate cyclodeaminase
MVANLTSGKKKYAEYQEDIEAVISRTSVSAAALLALIEKDAEVFEPLAAAYSIPREEPGRDEMLESALVRAASVPMEILRETANIIDIAEQLAVKGSKLAVSDIGVSASACRCAMESAVMNVYINTKLMKNREYAAKLNKEAELILNDGVKRCSAVYQKVTEELTGLGV